MRAAGLVIENRTEVSAIDESAADLAPIEMLRLGHLDRLPGLRIDPYASIFSALNHGYPSYGRRSGTTRGALSTDIVMDSLGHRVPHSLHTARATRSATV